MRHRKGFNHLGRTSTHRKAMLSNMASSLIKHKRIQTTTAKAKALRSYIEPLITKSKDDTTHSRRVVFSYLQDKDAVSELFREVSPKVMDRPGGYTRILKLGSRLGDSAEMAIIELVDFNPNLISEEADSKSGSSRRRGRRGKKKTQDEAQPVAASAGAETAIEEPEAQVQEPAGEETQEEAKATTEEAAAEKSDETTDSAVKTEEAIADTEEADTKEAAEEEKEEDVKKAPEASAEEKKEESKEKEEGEDKSDDKKES